MIPPNRNHYERIMNLLPPEMVKVFSEIDVNDYPSFVRSPGITDRMVDEESPLHAQTQSTLQMLFHTYLMKRHGEKIFVLEPDVGLMLAHTDIRGISGAQFKTPYREQLFILPPNLDFLTLYDPQTGVHRLSAVYVGYDGQELRLLAVGEANDRSKNEYDDTFAYFRFSINDSDLKTQIREQIERYSQDTFLAITGGVHNIGVAERLFNFVLNIVLYVCSPEADKYYEAWADVEPRITRMGGHARKAEITWLKANNRFLKIRLGTNTKLTTEQRQWYAQGSISTRTLVMGHWQHYHTGAGRVNEVLKWKTPFWRGVGEISNAPHIL